MWWVLGPLARTEHAYHRHHPCSHTPCPMLPLSVCVSLSLPVSPSKSLSLSLNPPTLAPHPLVSLDVVLELVFSRYYGWKQDVQDQLREAFLVFDEDRNGLELPEFKVRGPWSVVRGPWSVVSGPWSVVRGPLSVVRCPLSVVRCRLAPLQSRAKKANFLHATSPSTTAPCHPPPQLLQLLQLPQLPQPRSGHANGSMPP